MYRVTRPLGSTGANADVELDHDGRRAVALRRTVRGTPSTGSARHVECACDPSRRWCSKPSRNRPCSLRPERDGGVSAAAAARGRCDGAT
jgi:hypothetical protein